MYVHTFDDGVVDRFWELAEHSLLFSIAAELIHYHFIFRDLACNSIGIIEHIIFRQTILDKQIVHSLDDLVK
ncbi:Uncharacterised protein [Vibrio cholerae]|nr:Uncharacterised protein [Vibrio cholerae]